MNLLETIIGQLGGSAVDKIGSLLGEESNGTRKAVGAAVPFLLNLITNKATQNSTGAESIFGMLKDDDGGIMDNITDLLSSTTGRDNISNRGNGILSSLLGGNLDTVVRALSNFAGLRLGSSSSLLKMVAPMILSNLFKAKKSNGLNASGLANLLSGQASNFKNAIPSDFMNGLNALGYGRTSAASETARNVTNSTAGKLASTTGAASAAATTAYKNTNTAYVEEEHNGGLRKFLPWLLIGLLGLLLFGLYKGCSNNTDISKPNMSKIKTPKINKPQINKPKINRPKLDLSKLGISLNSEEGRFANMLNSGKAKIGSKFTLNKVQFDSGSTNIKASTRAQLDNFVKIMKNFPRLKVRLEGYTDSSGNAAKNLTLSKQRAESVKRYLITKGIAGNRLTSNGFGIAKPIADNSTRNGRAKNRRVEAVVTGL